VSFIDTIAAGNSLGFALSLANSTLESCAAPGNSAGLANFGSAEVRVSNSEFTNNTTGISNTFGGTVKTLGNNLVAGNTTNVDGTAPTPLAGE
jgi:hypothetical protein